ncbi:Rid family detoxifying hydrolase [Vagococcus bubulae]|uniref:Reactive intermediate/imine deaminase n=1 Tax=Vagococcus bubulae TaxID=1977868 RepID=A0A429ZRG0_9ENTE|nr:Rid family detoxifying hydrolase [Vagococcus bubulae]RST96314.1 reactive intermediate/imine deaminase [Vagococcus bubulae]
MSKLPKPIGPYSVYREAGNLVFVSGQIPIDVETGEIVSDTIEGQATQVMENIQLILEEIGVDFNAIVKTTCFLQDLEHFNTFNKIYGSYFKEKTPARSAFQVAKLPKGALLEVEFIVSK